MSAIYPTLVPGKTQLRPPVLSDIRDSLQDPVTPEYREKMIHRVPDALVVDRERYILEKCKGRKVLNIGSASGDLHRAIRMVAAKVWGVDKEPGSDTDIIADLDLVGESAWHPWALEGIEPELVVLGEILEHLGNPGYLLERLRELRCPLLITVPNAFCSAGASSMRQGIENVNRDHVAWYSWKTLKTLIERYHYTIQEFYWYKGSPRFAEGIIFLVC